jgi:Bacterial regulatory proteins, luxR family
VLNLNSAAETIFRTEDGLRHRHGRVTATAMRMDHELRRALRCALADGTTDVPCGQAFICVRSSGKRPYVIHALPLARGTSDETSRGPAALVLIIDPERENESATTLLRRLHRLTVTEAEVALRISRGMSLKQIADELSVSYQTIRTHVKLSSIRPTPTAKANSSASYSPTGRDITRHANAWRAYARTSASPSSSASPSASRAAASSAAHRVRVSTAALRTSRC